MNAREGRKSSTSHRQRGRAYIALSSCHTAFRGGHWHSEIGVLILKHRDSLVRAEPRNQAIGGRPKQEVVVVLVLVLGLHQGGPRPELLSLRAHTGHTKGDRQTRCRMVFNHATNEDETPTVVHPPANQTRSHIVCALHTLRPCVPGYRQITYLQPAPSPSNRFGSRFRRVGYGRQMEHCPTNGLEVGGRGTWACTRQVDGLRFHMSSLRCVMAGLAVSSHLLCRV